MCEMKKVFVFVLCAIVFCSCKKDEEKPAVDYASLLVGQWVYDHPEDGVWEIMEFTSSGMFYYSNSNDLYELENENVNGSYFVNGSLVTATCKLNEYTNINLDMQIVEINSVQFTAKFNDTGLTFTYAKQLKSMTIDFGEEASLNCGDLFTGGIRVLGYSSHNAKIAKVDPATGEVTGMSSGRTYIDIVTSEGTAVVEVIVKGLLPYIFDKFIGVDRTVIHETFGMISAVEDEEEVIYQNVSDKIQYIRFGFNLLTDKVSVISLCLVNMDKGYVEAMSEYLGNLYVTYDKGTTDDYKAYINHEKLEKASVGITWDVANLQITYVALSHDLFTDYSPLLGKTQTEVKYIMKDYQLYLEDNSQLAYLIFDGKIDMVVCYYTFDFVNTYETSQAVITQLNEELDDDEVIGYLDENYIYMPNESTNAERIYLTSDGLVAFLYDVEYNQILYVSNVPESRSLVQSKDFEYLREALHCLRDNSVVW